MSPLEHVGTLYMENQRLLVEYGKLLALVQSVKDGKTQIEQVNIDLDKASWAIEMTGAQFAAAVAPETTDEPTE